LIGTLSTPYQKFKLKEDGQRVNLRADDGIHMAPSGLRMINQALLDHIAKALRP
jgi:hypothetical protein